MTSKPPHLPLSKTLSSLPPINSTTSLRQLIKTKLNQPNTKIPLLVILDDDPTGTQTCHDISVLTVWDIPTLSQAFTSPTTKAAGGFFILTNSRALHPPEAETLMREICGNLLEASRSSSGGPDGLEGGSVSFEVVLRSDSTLRGHFPLEADVAESALNLSVDAWILAPFFLQGGRYTIDDVHYVAEGDTLVPAGETPFARDASFGYTSSNLREWVDEKSSGRIPLDKVVSLSIEDIRIGGPEKVMALLCGFPRGSVVIVNAAAEEDMDVVVLAILEAAEQRGKRFLYRSGAALVSSRLGIAGIPPKTSDALKLDKEVGGLVIAGSYVPKTTAQLKVLRERSAGDLTTIEVSVKQLLESEESATKVILDAVATAEKEINRGQDVLVMTSRDLITGGDERESLNIGSVVARNLVRFLQELRTRPRYVIAKGGITSSDMATKGLRMKCATVVGQAAPGVPLWECFEETSKWAGIPYIVFPGNVGSEDTLYEVVKGWRQ